MFPLARRRLPLFLASVGLVGCADVASPDPSIGQQQAPVIYGTDDRTEVFEASAAAQAAADSVVGLFFNSDISAAGDGTYNISTAVTAGESKDLCEGVTYADQYDSAFCTGFLVAADVIATAGHCVIDATDCGDTTFVFGWRMNSATEARSNVPASDVYTCDHIIQRDSGDNDWALIKTDRPIVGHAPLAVRHTGSIADGAPTNVIGHPFGIPAKVGGNATVKINSHPNYFETNLDTFAGNSGAPVFNGDFSQVEGILVRGNADLVKVGRGRQACYEFNTCPDSGCDTFAPFEEATRTTLFAHLIDDTPPPECTDDSYEENDTDADAPTLSGNDDLGNLQLCASDEDWFRVWVPAGQVLTATIDFSHAQGDLNLEVRDVGLGLIDASTGSGDSETVATVARDFDGTMFLTIKGVAGAQAGYTLTTRLSGEPPDETCGDGVCDADESCDGRYNTTACASDCPGQTRGKKTSRYCYVGQSCEGPGCP